jgi:TPR repeat protein
MALPVRDSDSDAESMDAEARLSLGGSRKRCGEGVASCLYPLPVRHGATSFCHAASFLLAVYFKNYNVSRLGVDQDYAQALYQKAANAGDTDAKQALVRLPSRQQMRLTQRQKLNLPMAKARGF